MVPRGGFRWGRPDRLVFTRIELQLPRRVWLGAFSHHHPDLVLKVHNTITVDQRKVLSDIEVVGPPRDWTEEIEGFPDVFGVERLELPPHLARYRVEYQTPAYYRLVHDLAIFLSYPRTIQHGVYTCETVARGSQVRRLVAAMNASRCRVRIVSIRPAEVSASRSPSMQVLTPVQQQLFLRALELGYFEVPRRITLSRLAERVGRSKSSVSHTLALVERSLARWASTFSG